MIKKLILFSLLISLMVTSCTKDFDKINTDPNNASTALPQQLLAPALVNVMRYNQIRNRNFNNELMQITVDLSDADGRVFRYDFRSSFSDYMYNGLYSELTNFKDIYKIAGEPIAANRSYQGISLICQSWIYSILTDTYGDIPYSQSNLARDSSIFEPAFDPQKDIYTDLFKKLEQADTLLKTGTEILKASDPVFNGDVAKWRKFGNSLYLRLLLRVSGKAEFTQFCANKIKQIVETNPADYPIISNNSESAILRWTGEGPYVSPLQTVREQDFRAPAIGSFFIDNLAIWNDPRIDIAYGANGINRWAIAPYLGSYAGVPSGYLPGTNPIKKSYFYSNTSKSSLQNDPLTGMILNYAEVQFILCEASVKGWISGSAETYYNNGVQSSITQWVPTWNVPIITYLTGADILWNNVGTQNQKMEQLHLQKYYAMFLVDYQQWFEYRRTGHPVLPMGPGLANGGVMPARMTYPVYVQSTNPTNYQIAVARQGPDLISTKVWWQKP